MKNKSYDLLLNRTFQYLGIVLVMAAMGGGYWYWKISQAAQTVESGTPSFEAPLTHDLNLSKGQGIATYSRADGADRRATVTDFEGRIIPVKQNEARFEGARRVENLIQKSESLCDTDLWHRGGPTGITCASDTDGWFKFTRVTDSDNDRIIQTFTATGDAMTVSVYVRMGTGTGGSVLLRNNTTGTNLTSVGWGAGQDGKRISFVQTTGITAGDSLMLYMYSAGVTGQYQYYKMPQVENIAGQTNQNPSEYVSTNVKTAFPYHGAGVDGVKYFDTQNGNTVASNVVTEATGAKIVSSTLRGYLAEGSRTNLLTYSEALNDASWTQSRLTITTNAVVAPNGQTIAEKLIEGTETATHRVYKSVTKAASPLQYTVSMYMKKAERTKGGIRLGENGETDHADILVDLNTGGTTVTTANGFTAASGSAVSAGNDWWRVQLTATTVNTVSLTIYIMPADASGNLSYTGDGTSGIYLWGAQLEQAGFASSYIPTTSASVTRTADNLTYLTNGNISSAVGSAYADITSATTTGAQASIIDGYAGSGGIPIGISTTGSVFLYDSVGGRFAGSVTRPITANKRFASVWSVTTSSIFVDGAQLGTDQSFSGSLGISSSMGIGVRPNGLTPLFGAIKNVRIWKKALSDTELQNMTSTTEGIATSAVKETTIANVPSNTGLVGYWSFEDGSGTKAEDFSPTGTNTGTLTNGPTWVDGKIGKAVNFDGTDDYVSLGNNALGNLGDLSTISVWIKASVGGEIISEYQASVCGDYSFRVSGGIAYAHDGGSATVTSVVNTLNNGNWRHIVVVSEENGTKIYIDGVLDASSSTDVDWRNSCAAQDVRVGRRMDGDNQFNGQIDDIRIYNRALTASEIAGLYAQGSAAKTIVNASQNSQLTDGLVGLWSFNGPDLSGTTAYDRSGQGNNGTLVNGPSVYPGKVGQALSFDGTSASVNLGQPAVLQTLNAPMTISSWVRFPTAPVSEHNYTIIGRGYDWQIEIRSTQRVTLRRWSSYSDVLGISALSATSWHHVVVTVSTSGSDNVLIYVNGQLDKTGTMTTPFNTSASNTRISGYIQADIDYFNGLIDEVRIYNRALSQSEVTALYNAGR
jgi:hypothetical protein